MWIIPPPRTKEQDEADMELFRKLEEKAAEESDARNEWLKNHPPCPHCGHQKEIPPWVSIWKVGQY